MEAGANDRSDQVAFVPILFSEDEEIEEDEEEEEAFQIDEGLRQGFLKLANIGAQVWRIVWL